MKQTNALRTAHLTFRFDDVWGKMKLNEPRKAYIEQTGWAAGEARKVILQPFRHKQREPLIALGSNQEGILNSASAVPHTRFGEEQNKGK